jgi:hypothetical protein
MRHGSESMNEVLFRDSEYLSNIRSETSGYYEMFIAVITTFSHWTLSLTLRSKNMIEITLNSPLASKETSVRPLQGSIFLMLYKEEVLGRTTRLFSFHYILFHMTRAA